MRKSGAVHLLWVFLAAFGTSATAQNNPTPFDINSLHSTYPLAGWFEGNYVIDDDSIVVTVLTGRMESHIPRRIGSPAEIRDLEVTVGLGVPYEDGWTIDTL